MLEDQHLKRVWFAETEDGPFEIYLTKRDNFGEKLAGPFASPPGYLAGGHPQRYVMFSATSVSVAKMLLPTMTCGRMVQFQKETSLC